MQLQNLISSELVGERIALFDIQPDSIAPEYLAWLTNRQVHKYLEARFEAHTPSGLSDFVTACAASPSTLLLGIRRLDEQRYIGNIKLSWDRNHMVGDIGIMLGDTGSWRHGFATEAVALLTRLGFELLQMRKLIAGVYEGNQASLRTFAKCGYRVEATLKEHVLLDSMPTDVYLMCILQHEYSTLARSA